MVATERHLSHIIAYYPLWKYFPYWKNVEPSISQKPMNYLKRDRKESFVMPIYKMYVVFGVVWISKMYTVAGHSLTYMVKWKIFFSEATNLIETNFEGMVIGIWMIYYKVGVCLICRLEFYNCHHNMRELNIRLTYYTKNNSLKPLNYL